MLIVAFLFLYTLHDRGSLNVISIATLVCVDVMVIPDDAWITHADVHSGGSVSSLYDELDIA